MITPNYPFAYAERAVAYLNLGKSDMALIDLNKVIVVSEHNYTTFFA